VSDQIVPHAALPWRRGRIVCCHRFRRFAVTALGEPPAVATTAAREREPGSTRQAEPDAVFQSSSSTQSRVLVTALRQRA
jgi:hypothetical protein